MPRRHPSPLTALVPLLVAASTRAQATDVPAGELASRIDAIAEEALAQEEVAGVSLAVAVGGDLLAEGGWGRAADGPASAGSRYPTGSLLEQLTAVAVLRLVAAGDLSLDTPLGELFPDAGGEEGTDDGQPPVTVLHLLSHTSGLPDRTDLFAAGREVSFEDVLPAIARTTPEAPPGECFAYSSTNAYLLARLLEHVAEEPLDQQLAALLAALDMDSTSFVDGADALGAGGAVTQEVPGEVATSDFVLAGTAELQSTVRDLIAWQRALVERELLADDEYALMTESFQLDDGTHTGAGCSVVRTSLGDVEGYSYGGGVGEHRVHVAYYAPVDLTVVVLLRGEAGAPRRIERRVARAVFDLPEPGVHDRPLTPELRELYCGAYQIGCNRVEIRERGERLAFSSVERDFELLYQGAADTFVSADDPDTRVVFERAEGRVSGFVLDEAGVQSVAVRFEHGRE